MHGALFRTSGYTPARKLPVKLILYVLYIGRDSHRNLSCLILIRIGEKTHCSAVNNDRGINTQFHVIKEHLIVYAQSCYLREIPIHTRNYI